MPRYRTDRETLERVCEVEFFIAGGPGGQHRNKRETGVRMTHPPSGITVTATERRSQQRNLDEAYSRMVRRLSELNVVRKIRRPTKPSRGAIERRLKSKLIRSKHKALRRKPHGED